MKLREGASAESTILPGASYPMIAGMPQSLSKVILHIIFSTKNREPWLDSGVRLRMGPYLATSSRPKRQRRAGGRVFDHVPHCDYAAENSFPKLD